MKNIYTNKNTACSVFTAKKENEEYKITPKKEIEIISNGVEVF